MSPILTLLVMFAYAEFPGEIFGWPFPIDDILFSASNDRAHVLLVFNVLYVVAGF